MHGNFSCTKKGFNPAKRDLHQRGCGKKTSLCKGNTLGGFPAGAGSRGANANAAEARMGGGRKEKRTLKAQLLILRLAGKTFPKKKIFFGWEKKEGGGYRRGRLKGWQFFGVR